MKIIAIATALYIGLAKAAPAIVWNSVSSSDGGSPLHISDLTDARSLLASTLNNGNNDNASNLSAVIFLVGRDADGSEGLNAMAASGKLPQVQAKQASASSIHYHVDGVESSRTVAKDAAAATLSEDGEEMNVVEVALEEFNRKLDSLAQSEATSATIEGGEQQQQQQQEKITKSEQKRRRAISDADILVVTLTDKDNAASIDSSIVKAIDSKLVQNVILSSIRSTDEVKHARRKLVIDKITKSARPSSERRRRLEDEDGQNNQNNNNNNQYQEGVYYVNMTPNIFSGLLFFFMFVFTAHLGLTCMNMIEGQDVYVKKYPTIGREV